MTRTLCPITQAAPADVQTVADLVAEAFFPLRASQWLVPDPGARRASMAGQFALIVEHALSFGHIDLLADRTAAAVWFHHTAPISPPPDYDQRLSVACGEHADRFQTLDALFETHHPGDPHHHLALLAVVGDRQGTGRGTLLLRHHHEVLDSQGIPAYLEAAGVRSASLYDREGYRPCGEPFCLPNEAFFYPMWRAPVRPGIGAATAFPTARRPINAPPVPPPATGRFVRRAPALA
jgi:GNAT superfamily N-acetyltransferase